MKQAISYKNIWTVSYPIILSGVAQNIVTVTDTAFLGRVGMVELGAAGNSGIFYMVLIMIALGFTIGCQIIIGRRNGEGKLKEIGKLFNSALFFLIPLAILISAFVYLFSPALLATFTSSPDILKASKDFLSVRCIGILFAFLNFLFVAFYTGIIQTKVLIKATFFQALINVLLDYTLIFGHFGFPELGIKGAALASVISEISALLYFIYYTRKHIDLNRFGLLQKFNFDFQQLKSILKVSSPIMVQYFMAITTWLSFFMIIEQIGEKELAVSHIIRSIYMVLMIPLFGFSSAASTLVSNVMGQGRLNEIGNLIRKIVYLSLFCTVLFLPIILIFPEWILGIYTNDESIVSASIPITNVIAGTMLFFSIAYILFSSVTGTGKTKVSLAIEFISISFYLCSAYLFAIQYEFSLPIVWCTEFIYFTIMGGISIMYLKYGNWKSSSI